MIKFYDAAGVEVTSIVFTSTEAGSDSEVVAFEAWHDRGAPGGTPRNTVRLVLEVQSPSDPSVYQASGWPPVDELWARYRITGVDNTSSPSWTLPTTDWRTLGARRHILIPTIPADAGVKIELKLTVPGSATATSWAFRLVPIYDELSRPTPPGPQEPGAAGVLWHNGDRRRSYVTRGCALSVAGDVATLAAGNWLHQGAVKGKVSTDHVLDQTDGDALALAAGESYVAALTLGSGVATVTKGSKNLAPDPPTPPAGDALVGLVEVHFDAGGTSDLDPADVSGETARGRFHAEPVGGLGVRVYPGEAVAGETVRYSDVSRLMSAPDDTTTTMWVLSDGSLLFADDPPVDDALDLWDVTAEAGAVTDLVDDRRPLRTPTLVQLAGALAVPGEVAFDWYDGPPIDVEHAVVRVSDAGAGASSGQTRFDVLVDGVSIFDTAAEDLRPAFAWDAAELAAQPIHQRPRLDSGSRVSLDVVELPVGGQPVSVNLSLIGARA